MNTDGRFVCFTSSGIRAALQDSLPGSLKTDKQHWFKHHSSNWHKMCTGLKDLYEFDTQKNAHLEDYSVHFKRISGCRPFDLLPLKVRRKGLTPYSCGQPWLCPWCSTRPTVASLRGVFRSLQPCDPGLFAGMMWDGYAKVWSVGDIRKVAGKDLDRLLDDVGFFCSRLGEAVYRNPKTRAFAARVRAYPGIPTEGSTPLLVSARLAVLADPESDLTARHVAGWEPTVGVHRPEFDRSPGVIQPGSTARFDGFAAVCRFVARYPGPLLAATTEAVSSLERLRQGLSKRKTMYRALHRLVRVNSPRPTTDLPDGC